VTLVEYAANGRSRCKACGEPIDKGELRVGVAPEGAASASPKYRWYHPDCAASHKRRAVLGWLADPNATDAVVRQFIRQTLRDHSTVTTVTRLERGEDWPQQALAHAEAQRWDAALEAMIRWWNLTPAIELADAIDAVSEAVTAQRPPPPHKRDAALAFVEQHLAAPDPAEFGRLVVALTKFRFDDSARWMRVLPGLYPDDPRWASTLLRWLVEVPTATNAEWWEAVYDAARLVRDPRLPERLRAFNPRAVFSSSKVQNRARWGLEAIEEDLSQHRPNPTPLDDDARASLDAIRATLARPTTRPGEARQVNQLEELLAQVHANPNDIPVKQVYADALMTVGGEHQATAELILLQCLEAPTREQKKRIKQLLRGWKTLLGDLAGVVLKDGLEFRHGFLHRCAVLCKTAEQAREVAGNPMWRTVADLEVRGGGAWKRGYGATELYWDQAMTGLRVARGVGSLIALCLIAFREQPLQHLKEMHALPSDRFDEWSPDYMERIELGPQPITNLDVLGLPAEACPAFQAVWAAGLRTREVLIAEGWSSRGAPDADVILGWLDAGQGCLGLERMRLTDGRWTVIGQRGGEGGAWTLTIEDPQQLLAGLPR